MYHSIGMLVQLAPDSNEQFKCQILKLSMSIAVVLS